ncbi:hypothetical protein HMPREF2760_01100 [Corynebacterium sp. HMSC065D07]|nr:hypothetical protein HMPREF2760_01100 [Corynebacterium sp. HMSC065D07]
MLINTFPKGITSAIAEGSANILLILSGRGEEDLEEAAFNHIIGDEKETYRERFNINDFSQFP